MRYAAREIVVKTNPLGSTLVGPERVPAYRQSPNGWFWDMLILRETSLSVEQRPGGITGRVVRTVPSWVISLGSMVACTLTLEADHPMGGDIG